MDGVPPGGNADFSGGGLESWACGGRRFERSIRSDCRDGRHVDGARLRHRVLKQSGPDYGCVLGDNLLAQTAASTILNTFSAELFPTSHRSTAESAIAVAGTISPERTLLSRRYRARAGRKASEAKEVAHATGVHFMRRIHFSI